MLAHLTALLLASASPAAPCGLHHPDACLNTNYLIWDDEFKTALRAFVGNRRASWLYKDGKESDQVIAALGGPPDRRREISPNLIVFSACRAHSCPEKGAVFMTPQGKIRAVAVLHFRCDDGCNDGYTLSILISAKDDPVIENARNWADETIATANARYPTPPNPDLHETEILLRP